MSIFGWSYPPGAANDPFAPYNQQEGPCEVCGHFVDDCICPECPICHAVGNPVCYEWRYLERTPEQIAGKAAREAEYKAQADADAAEYEDWLKRGPLDITKESQ